MPKILGDLLILTYLGQLSLKWVKHVSKSRGPTYFDLSRSIFLKLGQTCLKI